MQAYQKMSLIKVVHYVLENMHLESGQPKSVSLKVHGIKKYCLKKCFQVSVVSCKSAAMPVPTCMFNTTCESFQMRYCMTFYLKGHQIYQKSNSKVPKSLFLLSEKESLNLQIVAVLMPPWDKTSYNTSFESSHT